MFADISSRIIRRSGWFLSLTPVRHVKQRIRQQIEERTDSFRQLPAEGRSSGTDQGNPKRRRTDRSCQMSTDEHTASYPSLATQWPYLEIGQKGSDAGWQGADRLIKTECKETGRSDLDTLNTRQTSCLVRDRQTHLSRLTCSLPRLSLMQLLERLPTKKRQRTDAHNQQRDSETLETTHVLQSL